jgi:hypothetical protein
MNDRLARNKNAAIAFYDLMFNLTNKEGPQQLLAP